MTKLPKPPIRLDWPSIAGMASHADRWHSLEAGLSHSEDRRLRAWLERSEALSQFVVLPRGEERAW